MVKCNEAVSRKQATINNINISTSKYELYAKKRPLASLVVEEVMFCCCSKTSQHLFLLYVQLSRSSTELHVHPVSTATTYTTHTSLIQLYWMRNRDADAAMPVRLSKSSIDKNRALCTLHNHTCLDNDV